MDDRLMRIVAFLAVRRASGIDQGWVGAEELGLLATDCSAGAVAKYLERRLWTGRDGSQPPGRLIEFSPRLVILGPGGTTRGGISRGPWRLGIDPRQLQVDTRAALKMLVGDRIGSGDEYFGSEDALARSSDLLLAGDIQGAHLAVVRGLEGVARHGLGASRDRQALLGMLWNKAADLEMELGLPRMSLEGAERAHRLLSAAGMVLASGEALRVAAHAWGQLDENSKAVGLARRALAVADQTRALRQRAQRAHFVGVVAQRLTWTGQFARAERGIRFALEACADAGQIDWVASWAARHVQNYIQWGRLREAEQHLTAVWDHAGLTQLNVPQQAMIARTTTEFMLAVGRHDEAAKWAGEAWRIGMEKNMANQLRLVRPMLARLPDSVQPLMSNEPSHTRQAGARSDPD